MCSMAVVAECACAQCSNDAVMRVWRHGAEPSVGGASDGHVGRREALKTSSVQGFKPVLCGPQKGPALLGF